MLVHDGDVPDPYVLRTADGLACFATGSGGLDLQLLTAPAVTGPWTHRGDPLAGLPSWAVRGRTWSPSVLATGDGYALYAAVHERSSGRQVIAVWHADDPLGPYAPTGGPLVTMRGRGGAIDPDPYVGADGVATLLWKSDGRAIGEPSSLWGRELRPGGLGFAGRFGRPRRLLRQDARWEAPTIEAPCIARGDDGGLVLLYSGGAYEDGSYGIGWASGPEPLGPWRKHTPDAPWLGSATDLAGPGGQSVVVERDGVRWLVWHAWDPARVGYRAGGRRALHAARLDVDGRGVRLRA